MASPEAFSGYRNRPDADARAIRDGWYLTGDLSAEDGDGDLWVTGRVDYMINSGGENIYPDAHPVDDHLGQLLIAARPAADQRAGRGRRPDRGHHQDRRGSTP